MLFVLLAITYISVMQSSKNYTGNGTALNFPVPIEKFLESSLRSCRNVIFRSALQKLSLSFAPNGWIHIASALINLNF